MKSVFRYFETARVLQLLLVLGAVFITFGCDTEEEKVTKRLMGTWDCSAVTAEGTITGRSQMMRGGVSTSDLILSFEEGGQTLKINMLISGTWKVVGNDLIQAAKKIQVVRFNVNNRDIPVGSLSRGALQQIEQSFLEVSESSEIRVLTDDDLKTYSALSDVTTNCSKLA